MAQLRRVDAQSSLFGRGIGTFLLVVVVLAVYRIFIYADPSSSMLPDWEGDWDFAAADAKFLKKPRLVLFYENWRKDFKDYEKNVLSNPEIVARLKEELILVKVDASSKTSPAVKRAEQYRVRLAPALMVLYPDGKHTDLYLGIRTPDDIVRWSLHNAKKR